MRLLHVVPTYLPALRYGGPIVAVHGLCRALAARGHAVEVFTTSIDGPRDSDVPHGVPVMLDGVTVRYFTSPALRRLSWAPSLARALRHEMAGADLLHLHSVFLWPTAAAARLARRREVPYVISPRGMLVNSLVDRRHRALKRLWIAAVERQNLEHAAAVHVTSVREAAEFAEFGFRARRVAAIPNGVDGVAAPPVGRRQPPPEIARLATLQPLLLSFGRLSWVKRLDRLIEEFACSGRGHLAIVGTDDEGLAPQLQRRAAELGIGERIHIVPRTVTGDDKEAVFAAASGFAMASLSESFGNTAIEAMQCGLPVIVTRQVGAAGIVTRSGGGFVVGDETGELATAIAALNSDPAMARRMGEAGRAYVAQHCGWPAVAEEMEDLYRSLIGRTGGER